MPMPVQQESWGRRYEHLFIGGEWLPAKSGQSIASINPATGKVWAQVPEAGETDIDHAVAAACQAFEGGPWRTMSASDRGNLLYQLAGRLQAESEHFALLETQDTGLPIRDTRGDVAAAVAWLTYYAGLADKIEGSVIPARPDWHSYTLREAVGVVGAITPWNGPLIGCAWKLGPALAAGCTVVLKPAEQTPVTALELGRLIAEVGFPKGVVNIVPGYGPTAGVRLVAHPNVNKIAFTGEHTTAQEIMRGAAGTLKRFTAECGGKAPQIIFADADLEQAVQTVAAAGFRRTGQTCALGSRIFVQSSAYVAFVQRLKELASLVRVGDPLSDRTHIGPHTSHAQLEKTLRYVQIGQDEGARLVWGGKRPTEAALQNGYFVQPTVFADVENQMQIAQQEIFGPVVSTMPFQDEEELVSMANGVIYGLTAGIWTNDIRRAHRVANKLRAGSVWINVYPAVRPMLPYGGYKLSGIGRENGIEAIHEYTEVKTVVVNLSGEPVPYPFGE